MALILNIETSTDICSVSISKDGDLLASKETNEERSHAKMLAKLIDDILSENNLTTNNLDAVSVSKGPGSYTGLRIGVSTAKGICYASDLPLIALNTLEIMAGAAQKNENYKNDGLLCPMIDARRQEVYQALFNSEVNVVDETSAKIIDTDSYKDEFGKGKVYFFGNGAPKCKEFLTSTNAIFLDDVFPNAKNMAQLSELYFNNEKFEDVAYFEPFYLKEFVATTPKNKVL